MFFSLFLLAPRVIPEQRQRLHGRTKRKAFELNGEDPFRRLRREYEYEEDDDGLEYEREQQLCPASDRVSSKEASL